MRVRCAGDTASVAEEHEGRRHEGPQLEVEAPRLLVLYTMHVGRCPTCMSIDIMMNHKIFHMV